MGRILQGNKQLFVNDNTGGRCAQSTANSGTRFQVSYLVVIVETGMSLRERTQGTDAIWVARDWIGQVAEEGPIWLHASPICDLPRATIHPFAAKLGFPAPLAQLPLGTGTLGF